MVAVLEVRMSRRLVLGLLCGLVLVGACPVGAQEAPADEPVLEALEGDAAAHLLGVIVELSQINLLLRLPKSLGHLGEPAAVFRPENGVQKGAFKVRDPDLFLADPGEGRAEKPGPRDG